MNIEPILREIDAEIEKLQRIRLILERLLEPKSQESRRERVRVKGIPPAEVKPEPRLIVLPPKQRREHTRRAKPSVVEPKALAAPVTNGPIFVPKGALHVSRTARIAVAGNALEHVMRKKLVGARLAFV
jgi:hypothetical protein